MKDDLGTGLLPGFAGFLEQSHGDAALIFLFERAAVAPDFKLQQFRQCVDAVSHADAVQAAGNFVGIGVELAAGMQLGHHHLRRTGHALFFMHVDRDAFAPLSTTVMELSS